MLGFKLIISLMAIIDLHSFLFKGRRLPRPFTHFHFHFLFISIFFYSQNKSRLDISGLAPFLSCPVQSLRLSLSIGLQVINLLRARLREVGEGGGGDDNIKINICTDLKINQYNVNNFILLNLY